MAALIELSALCTSSMLISRPFNFPKIGDLSFKSSSQIELFHYNSPYNNFSLLSWILFVCPSCGQSDLRLFIFYCLGVFCDFPRNTTEVERLTQTKYIRTIIRVPAQLLRIRGYLLGFVPMCYLLSMLKVFISNCILSREVVFTTTK